MIITGAIIIMSIITFVIWLYNGTNSKTIQSRSILKIGNLLEANLKNTKSDIFIANEFFEGNNDKPMEVFIDILVKNRQSESFFLLLRELIKQKNYYEIGISLIKYVKDHITDYKNRTNDIAFDEILNNLIRNIDIDYIQFLNDQNNILRFPYGIPKNLKEIEDNIRRRNELIINNLDKTIKEKWYNYSNCPSIENDNENYEVSCIEIKVDSELKFSLIDGEHRTFQNHYISGAQYTFGFPKENCRDKRVWVGIGKDEVERISHDEAMRRIWNNKISTNAPTKQLES